MEPQPPEQRSPEPPSELPPPPVEAERCYRHADEETRVHCTRCGRPICPQCMIPAPVGHQCPECVGAARKEFRQGPGRRVAGVESAPVTRVLLIAILAMFVVEILVGGAGSLFRGPGSLKMVDLGAAVSIFPAPDGSFEGIATGQYWRLFTSMFLHFGLLHLGFNAYALWLFGPMVERSFGHLRFALIYLVGGLVGGAASYAFGPAPELLAPSIPVGAIGAGASGAIFAVFGAFAAYNYRRRHLAAAAANLRSAIMLLAINLFLAFAISGIDWRAHAGGLIAGVVAGLASDEMAPRKVGPLVSGAGFVALVAVSIGLVAWRTMELRDAFPGLI